MTDYTDRHRSFLQAIAAHCTMEIPQALELLNALNEKFNAGEAGEDDLSSLINEINSKIEPLDQQIKYVKHDIVKKEFIVFVNTIEDDINKKQSYYSDMDREFFRLLLQEITLNGSRIQRIVALNLIAQLKPKPFTKSHGQELLDDWIELGYFIEDENLLYFGPKTLGEFSDYLAKNFSDYVKKCKLCTVAVLMGPQCESCDELFHRDCLRKALIKSLTCPKCKAEWNQRVD